AARRRARRGVRDRQPVPRRPRRARAAPPGGGDAQPGPARRGLRARREARAARGLALEPRAHRLRHPARAHARGGRARQRRDAAAGRGGGREGRAPRVTGRRGPARPHRRPPPAGLMSHTPDELPDDGPPPRYDAERAERAVRELLLAVGEDPDREGLRDTPARVARAYAETFSGLHQDPAAVLTRTFDLGHEEMILVKD